jgi:hypothetical protein
MLSLLQPIAWRMIHLLVCLVSLYALPLHLSATLSGTNDPALLILKTLFLQLGLPLFVVSSSAPLLQFSYLRDCPSQAHIIERDGRLAMADMVDMADASNELVIMDTFSSDAIPVHMLTQEAFTLYQKKLTSQEVILINISNRHINALSVITAAAHQLDFILLYKNDPGNSSKAQLASQWALLTTNESLANHLIHTEGWHFVTDQTYLLWTDDYSNIIPLLKLR